MPSFTIQLKNLVNDDYSNLSDIGLEWYPIFDDPNSTYRAGLNKKIIQHFWNREIGQETQFLFKFAMGRKMNEIMPRYNQLYLTELSRMTDLNGNKIDPLSTVKLITDTTGTDSTNASSTSTNSSSTTGGTRTVNMDTPQVGLSGNADYASAAVDVNSQNSANTDSSGTDDRTSDTTSNATSNGYSEHTVLMVQRLRGAILNIDMMIIDDLNELFMGVWDNGDEFTRKNGWGYL